MHTLAQLRSGELKGLKRIKISENLTEFPQEIFTLADTLEILDLSNNSLSCIPKDVSKLKKLKIAFFSNNLFTSVPSEFKECYSLYMLGFKANKIKEFPEDILPLNISWLILTDNKISVLPNSMGKLVKLQKCTLSGNKIEKLPESMKECKNLELIRLSANQLKEIPKWLLKLPKLSWLAFSGNPCVKTPKFELNSVDYKDLELRELLGKGASGEIFKAYSKELEEFVAVKFFKGAVTSDGYAKDEMNACLGVGPHNNLINVLGKIEGHERLGLLLEYISSEFRNLGAPPSFDTCTRDTYSNDMMFSMDTIVSVAKAISSVAAHMHEKNLMHGDLYAHNILIHDDDRCYLGDFGAASFYDAKTDAFEKIEIRAFGCLLEDMLLRCSQKEGSMYKNMMLLKESCMNINTEQRPLFSQMKFKY